jgi:hypothetical protein
VVPVQPGRSPIQPAKLRSPKSPIVKWLTVFPSEEVAYSCLPSAVTATPCARSSAPGRAACGAASQVPDAAGEAQVPGRVDLEVADVPCRGGGVELAAVRGYRHAVRAVERAGRVGRGAAGQGSDAAAEGQVPGQIDRDMADHTCTQNRIGGGVDLGADHGHGSGILERVRGRGRSAAARVPGTAGEDQAAGIGVRSRNGQAEGGQVGAASTTAATGSAQPAQRPGRRGRYGPGRMRCPAPGLPRAGSVRVVCACMGVLL